MELTEQSERLLWILNHLNITPYRFSKKVGYKTPDSVYNIIRKKNFVSLGFLHKLKNTFPEINVDWLHLGNGQPLVYNLKKGRYGDEYIIDGKILYPAGLSFLFLKKIAINFSEVLFTDHKNLSYIVKVKICAIEGLEFYFELFYYDNGCKMKDRVYVLAVQPDWKVGIFFDYWNIDEPNRRCENLSELSKSMLQGVTSAVAMVLDEIDNYDYNQKPYLKFDDSFKELYRTDSR